MSIQNFKRRHESVTHGLILLMWLPAHSESSIKRNRVSENLQSVIKQEIDFTVVEHFQVSDDQRGELCFQYVRLVSSLENVAVGPCIRLIFILEFALR